MISVLLVLGQCICVIGLIYGALLATVSIDWADDRPADSLKADPSAGYRGGISYAAEPRDGADRPMRAL